MNTCQMLKDAILDEKEAADFYKKLEVVVSKTDRWKIDEIKNEENTHREELQQIIKRYCK